MVESDVPGRRSSGVWVTRSVVWRNIFVFALYEELRDYDQFRRSP